jgi:hypothetical protein
MRSAIASKLSGQSIHKSGEILTYDQSTDKEENERNNQKSDNAILRATGNKAFFENDDEKKEDAFSFQGMENQRAVFSALKSDDGD